MHVTVYVYMHTYVSHHEATLHLHGDGGEEIAQWLCVLIAFIEEPSLVSSTHIR